MASRFISPTFDSGPGIKPATGAKLFFFETGTSTDKDTFTDAGAETPNANPVIADSNGVFPDIFISGIYKVVLKDKNDVQVGFGEADPVNEFAIGNFDTNLINDLSQAYEFATVEDATSTAINLPVGKLITIDSTSWAIVLLSTVTVDDYEVFSLDNFPTLALVSIDGSRYDLTNIKNDVAKFASSMTRRGQNAKVVVTGGSVSFNGFAYSEFSVDGSGYATDQPFGMSSWPHLIRDFWVAAHPSFIPIERVNLSTDTVTAVAPSSEFFGMNTKILKFTFSNLTESIVIDNPTHHVQYLIVSLSSPTFGSQPPIFDVNGVTFDSTSPDDDYKGRGYFFVLVGSNTSITIDNVNTVASGAGGIMYLYGLTGAGNPNFKITGKGGYSSGQILAEYSTLVAPYTPNFVIYMVGGNDSGTAVPISTFKQNIRDFVALVRVDEPEAVIVLSGTTPNTAVVRSLSLSYNLAMREVADELNVSMIDMYSRLEHVDPAYWRFDNTHFTADGDTMIFNIMKSLLFKSVDVPKESFVPARANYIGLNRGFYDNNAVRAIKGKGQLAAIQATVTAPTVTMVVGVGITASYSGSGVTSKMIVNWPVGFNIAGMLPFFVGGAGASEIRMEASISGTSAQLFAVDSTGAAIDIINSGIRIRILTS